MPIQILMPALSPTMTEGNLAKWLVKEGDMVNSGDVIAEIETDKATMEVEAVEEGVLGRILVAEGTESVAVNTPIGLILEEGESDSDLEGFATGEAGSTVSDSAAAPGATGTEPRMATAQPVATGRVADRGPRDQRVFASPLAKRLAKDAGLDLALLTGSGPHGRIVKRDVEKAKAEGVGKPTPPAGPVQLSASRPDQDIPNSNVRKVIARRLSEAKRDIPHFYLSMDCELDALLDLRAQVNATSPEGDGAYKTSVNDFIIRAVALALREVPAANASWNDDAIRLYGDVDVSVAVATPNGLMTPIIRQADLKSLVEISKDMKSLATRARDGKLKPEEFQGGGFTISNLGMYGISSFSAIINPPQSCILAIGAGEQRPVVRDGQIQVATVMTCTLSVDHRSVDGAVGAEFLGAFKRLIQSPLKLLL